MSRIIGIIITAIILCQSLFAATIWRDRNIYSSEGDLQPGDVIIVKVTDFSKFKFDVKLDNNSSSNIIFNPDITITGFLPNISSNKNFKNNEATTFNGNSRIDVAIAATITGKQTNGFALISGTRSYAFNGVTNTVTISGIVNPKFLKAGTIDSNSVADFRIQITGRKEGLTVRVGQIGEGETASTQLTEQEKQRIIIDYLEKIVKELTR